MREIPQAQRVLRVLYYYSQKHPKSPFLEPKHVKKALGAKNQNVHVVLLRLWRQKQIRKQPRGKGYALTPLGLKSIELRPDIRPWKPGVTELKTAHASYQVVDILRPVGRAVPERVQVFKALVTSVTGERADPKLKPGDTVVIKTLSNAAVDRLRALVDTTAKGVLDDLNKAFGEETAKVEASPWLARIARTLDWGWEPIAISAGGASKIPFVVQEYIGGPDLAALLRDERSGDFKGCDDLAKWFQLADELAVGLKEVHAAGMFHRHIWPYTILIEVEGPGAPRGPVFVDLVEGVFFAGAWPDGNAENSSGPLTGRSESHAATADLPALNAVDFLAPEWRDKDVKEPSRSADLYSLGAVLYYALTGRPPRFGDGISPDELKQAVQRDLRNTIGDGNFGVADIISRCLRPAIRFTPENQHHLRASDVHSLLSDIRTFSGTRRSFIDIGAGLLRSAMELARADTVFSSLAAIELEQLERVFRELQRGSVTIRGEHNDFVLKLCSYLSTLGPGDEYWTVTVPDFWRHRNLGHRGRFLSMNAEIARRGARVVRIFLLTQDDMRNPDVVDIVRAHLEVADHLPKPDLWEVRYVPVTLDERKKEKDASVGYWVRGNSLVKVKATYYREGINIKDITISHVSASRDTIRRKWLKRFEDPSRPLQEWMDEAKTGR